MNFHKLLLKSIQYSWETQLYTEGSPSLLNTSKVTNRLKPGFVFAFFFLFVCLQYLVLVPVMCAMSQISTVSTTAKPSLFMCCIEVNKLRVHPNLIFGKLSKWD